MTANDFEHTLRVYWEDTDAGGVVFFANYLKFFERARTEWLRSLGFSQESMRVDDEAAFVVSETRVRYLRPARLDDLLTITVRLAAAARASSPASSPSGWSAASPSRPAAPTARRPRPTPPVPTAPRPPPS